MNVSAQALEYDRRTAAPRQVLAQTTPYGDGSFTHLGQLAASIS